MKRALNLTIGLIILSLIILGILVLIGSFFFLANIQNNTVAISEEGTCLSESRSIEICQKIAKPVCGWFSSKIQCIKYPCAQTYPNSCFACQNEDVEHYTKGECPVD